MPNKKPKGIVDDIIVLGAKGATKAVRNARHLKKGVKTAAKKNYPKKKVMVEQKTRKVADTGILQKRFPGVDDKVITDMARGYAEKGARGYNPKPYRKSAVKTAKKQGYVKAKTQIKYAANNKRIERSGRKSAIEINR